MGVFSMGLQTAMMPVSILTSKSECRLFADPTTNQLVKLFYVAAGEMTQSSVMAPAFRNPARHGIT